MSDEMWQLILTLMTEEMHLSPGRQIIVILSSAAGGWFMGAMWQRDKTR